MTAEQLFSILNLMTMAAWLPLVLLPRVRWTATPLPVANEDGGFLNGNPLLDLNPAGLGTATVFRPHAVHGP